MYNSPLSEYAALGFEYGYSVAAPEALVLWEAQFGDFVNGAQIVIDQFIVAGLSKWGQTSRLTLLLPHGYEGNGPEHSSARLERFLQLAAQENIRIVNPTTPAQFFHLLRRQALDPRAAARRDDAEGPAAASRSDRAPSTARATAPSAVDRRPGNVPTATARRLVLCSGKLYYDIVGHEERANAERVAIARIEQLYPFPADEAAELVAWLRRAGGDRLGAGGTAEHGCVARSAIGSRTLPRWRAFRCATSGRRGARARARAIRPRTCASRTGSSARRSASALAAGRPAAPVRECGAAARGACFRVAFMI